MGRGRFARDVAFVYFKYRDSVAYWRVAPAPDGVELRPESPAPQTGKAEEPVHFSGDDVSSGRFAVWCARKALLENCYFLVGANLPPTVTVSLKAALGRVAGPRKVPLFDHAVTGSVNAARRMIENYDAWAPEDEECRISCEGDADPDEPQIVSCGMGKGRYALVASRAPGAPSGRLDLYFGAWSSRKRRLMTAEEERNSAKSRFVRANAGASPEQLQAFGETYRTVLSHAVVDGVDAMISAMDRLVGRYDPLVIAGDGIDGAAASELFAVYGPSRMYRARSAD